MSGFRTKLWWAPLVLLATTLHAQDSKGLDGETPNSRNLTVQRKVEQLFETGDFERAYFIYRNELVPAGDKYAQYMVGYMHLTGLGVDEDEIAASAWYRLAAERGTPEFVAVRDQLLRGMEPEQRARSDRSYLELRREYGDLVVLLASIKRNVGKLGVRTGSRLKSDSGSLLVVGSSSPQSGGRSVDYYGRVQQELHQNLVSLSELGDFPDLDTNPERVDVDEIERLVQERLETPID